MLLNTPALAIASVLMAAVLGGVAPFRAHPYRRHGTIGDRYNLHELVRRWADPVCQDAAFVALAKAPKWKIEESL